jgi:AbrB family looped-hinge helix DNA binding protein
MPRTKKVETKRVNAAKTEAPSGKPIAAEPSRVGKRGTVVIPAALRRHYGIEEGTLVIAEPREGGVLIRPALLIPVEVYTPERKAQFLLSNAIDAADYVGALATVRAMGLDPDTIPHYKPPGLETWTGSSSTPTFSSQPRCGRRLRCTGSGGWTTWNSCRQVTPLKRPGEIWKRPHSGAD